MSDSVRPHKWKPTRLPHPGDSPGKNTGVGCHFLLLCMKVKSESEVVQSCLIFSDPMDCSPPGSSVRGIFQARVLSRLVITFLPRSKRLLISWWQSSSAVILKPQKNKVWHSFHCFPIYFPWSDGTTWLCQSLWLCGLQQTVENSERDGYTRPPDLPLEKPIYRSGSNS